jgi:predicted nucleic-acid-binding Zn-ribbon protein
MKIINKIVCFLKGHRRGYTKVSSFGNDFHWTIKCKRCGYTIGYLSPKARLVSIEILHKFDGK